MQSSTRRNVTVTISAEVWKAAKIFAIERGVTLNQLVENAILRELRAKQD